MWNYTSDNWTFDLKEFQIQYKEFCNLILIKILILKNTVQNNSLDDGTAADADKYY